MTDEERLSAYLDGALTEAEMASVEARLSSDAAFATQLDRLAGNDVIVRDAYDSILSEPAPPALIAAALGEAAAPTASNDNQRGWWAAGGAIAASLALAIGLFSMTPKSGQDNAQIAFNSALDKTPSAQSVNVQGRGKLTPQFSFASKDGGYCRQFVLEDADQAETGLACRNGADWKVEALVKGGSNTNAQDGYATASGTTTGLDAAIEARRSGDPLSAEAERGLISKGWAVR